MSGGGDFRRMSIDSEPMSINSRALVVSDPSALNHFGPNSPFPREDMQNGIHGQHPVSLINRSQKLQDDLQKLGERIKHHEDNIKFLKNLRNKLDDSILDTQVAIGKHITSSFSKGDNEDTVSVVSEEETIEHILKYENSAAAIVCKLKRNPAASDQSLTNDVLGVVASLGKVDDANLSRLLSEYLGLETMLAVVCKTYEGVKALEGYTKDGSINKALGIHAVAALDGQPLDNRFRVICLDNLKPYAGQLIADDPQRRLDIQKPRLISGQTPPGFLGFAVNMVVVDNTKLYCISRNRYSLRETLFYNLFSNLQVYRSREDMLKAQSYITDGAISLDGGVIRSPGIFSLGYNRGDINVKFPCDSKGIGLPVSRFEFENRLKETKWKKDRASEDMQREQALLDHTRFNYETKKRDFVQCLAETSLHVTQVGRVSTPR